jgi:parvulin-like peptidyl-prolyl isomerase
MKVLFLYAFATASLLAQSAAPASAKPSDRVSAFLALPPDTVVAVVDGEKIPAVQLQVVVRNLSPAQADNALQNPRLMVEQYALMKRLAAMAEKAGLDQKSPLKEQLAYNRMVALAPAQLQARENEMQVTPEEVESFYQANKDRFTTAQIKLIYIPFSPNAGQKGADGKKVLSEAEARAKAESIYAELQKGADFVKMVKEHSGDAASASKDGDYGTLRRSDSLPEEVKAAVFGLKAGEFSRPVRQPNGFYIFRAESVTVEPLEKVRTEVTNGLMNGRVDNWVQSLRKSIDVKIENEALFTGAAPAAVK